MKPGELEGKDMKGFTVQRLTEVFKADENGKKTSSLRYVRDEITAVTYAEGHLEAKDLRIREVFILTDGDVSFPLEGGEGIEITDDETMRSIIRTQIISNLPPRARAFLKL